MRQLVAVLVILLSVVGARAQTDHLQCFKVRDPQARASYTANIDGLVLEAGCIVKVPAAMACVPASKTIVGPPFPPGGGGTGTPSSFFCYKVKCPRLLLPPLAGTDQFGSRSVQPSTAKLVCAPLASATTTSTTSSTSTTIVDTHLPTIEFADPPVNQQVTANTTPRFYFSAFDCEGAVSTYCSVAGDPFVPCTSPFTTRTLSDGSYSGGQR